MGAVREGEVEEEREGSWEYGWGGGVEDVGCGLDFEGGRFFGGCHVADELDVGFFIMVEGEGGGRVHSSIL